MTTNTLKLINKTLSGAKINYAYHTLKTKTVSYPYWIGESSESPPDDETGFRQSTFILTGTTDGTWGQLLSEKDKIETLFKEKKAIHDNGHAVAFFVEQSFEVPTELDTLKRIQLNITVQEWRN